MIDRDKLLVKLTRAAGNEELSKEMFDLFAELVEREIVIEGEAGKEAMDANLLFIIENAIKEIKKIPEEGKVLLMKEVINGLKNEEI